MSDNNQFPSNRSVDSITDSITDCMTPSDEANYDAWKFVYQDSLASSTLPDEAVLAQISFTYAEFEAAQDAHHFYPAHQGSYVQCPMVEELASLGITNKQYMKAFGLPPHPVSPGHLAWSRGLFASQSAHNFMYINLRHRPLGHQNDTLQHTT